MSVAGGVSGAVAVAVAVVLAVAGVRADGQSQFSWQSVCLAGPVSSQSSHGAASIDAAAQPQKATDGSDS